VSSPSQPFYSVLSLVCHLVALSMLFLLLRAEFVAAAQVIIYAGAVMVLYVFVVAYVGVARNSRPATAPCARTLFAVAIAIELSIAMLGSALSGISGKGPVCPRFGSPGQIGRLFLTSYLLPFEVASLLLLVAAVGAVVLARRRRGSRRRTTTPSSTASRVRPPVVHRHDGRGAGIQRVLDEIERDETARAAWPIGAAPTGRES